MYRNEFGPLNPRIASSCWPFLFLLQDSKRGFEANSSSLPGVLQPDTSMYLRSTTYQHLQQSNQHGTQTRQSLFQQQLLLGSSGQNGQGVIPSPTSPPMMGTQASPPIMGTEASHPGQCSITSAPQPHGVSQVCQPGSDLESVQLCSKQLPFHVVMNLSKRLNVKHILGNDWRMLASNFGMSIEEVLLLDREDDPTGEVVSYISQTKPNTYARDIIKVLRDIKRPDAAEIIESYLREPSPDMSTGESSSSGYSPWNGYSPEELSLSSWSPNSGTVPQ